MVGKYLTAKGGGRGEYLWVEKVVDRLVSVELRREGWVNICW